MSKRAVLWVGVYVAALAVLIAGVVPLVRQGNGKVTAAAVPGEQAVMPFPTAIDVGRSTVSVGDVTTVSVGGTSTKGITTIDLYDGGRRVSTVRPPKGQFISQVAYPALEVGPHALHAEVTDGKETVRAKLKTPEAYYLTALTSVEIMKHILDGDYKAGFQTPSKVYGADFILQFAGVTREDLQ